MAGLKNDWLRNYVRLGVVLAALCGFQVANAQGELQGAPGNAFQWMTYRMSGNTTQVGVYLPQSSQTTASRPTNLSGWTPAGNYGAAPTATGITVTADANVPYGSAGKTAPMRMSAPISKGAMAAAAATLMKRAAAMGTGPLGMLLNLASMAEWLTNNDMAANPGSLDKPLLVRDSSWEAQCVNTPAGWLAWVPTRGGTDGNGQPRTSTAHVQFKPTTCFFGANVCDSGGCAFVGYEEVAKRPKEQVNMQPMSIDDVMSRNSFENGALPSRVLQDLIDWDRANPPLSGVNPFKVDVGPATVTGPASLPSGTTTKSETTTRPCPTQSNPNATCTVVTTTTTTTTPELTYTQDKAKVQDKTTTTVTTKTTNPDGSTTETTDKTTTEEKPEPEQESDLCKLHPDILACSKPELDTPTGEIPRTTKTLNYQPENLGFGGGSCPADITQMIGGRAVTIFSYAKACEILSGPVRALVLVLGAWIAMMILMPGGRVE